MPGKAKLWETVSDLELAYLSLASKVGLRFVFLVQSSVYQLAFKLSVNWFINYQTYSLVWVASMKVFSGVPSTLVLSIQIVSQYCLVPIPLRY